MSKEQFLINYNGHPVAVTPTDNDNYLVQISYKPYRINRRNIDNKSVWFDSEINAVTDLSSRLGNLIESSVANNELVKTE